jgi:hypothetical protein
MKYLGVARKENGRLVMPDAFAEAAEGQAYEALDVGGDILLIPSPLDKDRLDRIRGLAKESIREHRNVLEKLAK